VTVELRTALGTAGGLNPCGDPATSPGVFEYLLRPSYLTSYDLLIKSEGLHGPGLRWPDAARMATRVEGQRIQARRRRRRLLCVSPERQAPGARSRPTDSGLAATRAGAFGRCDGQRAPARPRQLQERSDTWEGPMA
jgi:hypothetical protein